MHSPFEPHLFQKPSPTPTPALAEFINQNYKKNEKNLRCFTTNVDESRVYVVTQRVIVSFCQNGGSFCSNSYHARVENPIISIFFINKEQTITIIS